VQAARAIVGRAGGQPSQQFIAKDYHRIFFSSDLRGKLNKALGQLTGTDAAECKCLRQPLTDPEVDSASPWSVDRS
jgi:hypothetical protein